CLHGRVYRSGKSIKIYLVCQAILKVKQGVGSGVSNKSRAGLTLLGNILSSRSNNEVASIGSRGEALCCPDAD
ncbi:MAG: hypothetical protein LJE74_11710, partial [Proteobacteria bacterium]|nr:hypothetical protein [Pseudomonadota bacterium]